MEGTTPPVVILPEAAQLGATLVALRIAQKRVMDDAIKSESRWQAMRLAQLGEAIDIADDVLFNVLNTASSMCDCSASAQAIEDSRPGRPPLRSVPA